MQVRYGLLAERAELVTCTGSPKATRSSAKQRSPAAPTARRGVASGVILGLVGAAGTLTDDRVFDVFGDHSYRMDLRG